MNPDLATQRAIDRFHRDGTAALTEEERVLVTIWYFEAKVANGGFVDFFKSAEGELARYAPDALRAIGAEPLAQLAERANAVFGSSGVPAERDRRRELLRSLPAAARAELDALTEQYYGFDEDLSDRLEAFLARSR